MANPYLQIENLTKSFGDKVLFEGLSFGVAEGQRIALIARNGIGKSTLLDLITGKQESDSGSITFRNDLRVGYLSQEQGQRTKDKGLYCIADAIQDADVDKLEAEKFLTRLGITNLTQPMEQLSGGQRKRVALALVLASQPDLLILDEPTNHLDLEMVEWLEQYLRKPNITLLLVTHDRYFLDRVCTDILEIDNQQIYTYHGNYAYYLEKRAERLETQQAEIDKARNLYRTELEWMRRMPQARGHKAQYRVDAFAGLEQKAKQQISNEQIRLEVKSTYIGNKIFEAKGVSKAFDSLTILHNFSYIFSRYEKVGIIGNNGTGKTTFLKLLLGIEQPDSGHFDIGQTVRFGYYRQEGLAEIQAASNKKVIDLVKEKAEFIDLGDGKRLSASQFLQHFLFSPSQQYDYIEKLSGGEKQRLHLCMVLMQSPNFLILDEPTNDLDIPTLAILEEYLRAFKGCLIVVSHDRYFMDKVVDHLFVFKGQGEIQDFPGNYTQWRAVKASLPSPHEGRRPMQDKKNTQGKSPLLMEGQGGGSKPRKLSFKEKQELAQLEKDMPLLEQEKADLEQQLSGGLADPEAIATASKRYEEVTNLLDEKEMRWLELSEI